MGPGSVRLPRMGIAADGVVADVALVVGVDEVLSGASEGGEGLTREAASRWRC